MADDVGYPERLLHNVDSYFKRRGMASPVPPILRYYMRQHWRAGRAKQERNVRMLLILLEQVRAASKRPHAYNVSMP